MVTKVLNKNVNVPKMNVNELYVTARVTRDLIPTQRGDAYMLKLCIVGTKRRKRDIYITAIASPKVTENIKDVKAGDTVCLRLAIKTNFMRSYDSHRLNQIYSYFVRNIWMDDKMTKSNQGRLTGRITELHIGRTSGNITIMSNKHRDTKTILTINRKSALNDLRNFKANDWVDVDYSLHAQIAKGASVPYKRVATVDHVNNGVIVEK